MREDAKNKAKPDPVQTSDHKGVVVYAVGGEKGAAYAIIAGTLAISNSPKNLVRLIDERIETKSAGDLGDAKKIKPALLRFTDQPEWKAIRERQGADADVWGYADLDRLKTLDPKKFTLPEKGDTGIVLFFGSWYEVLRQAHSIQGSIRWSATELTACSELPLSKEGRPATIKGYVPDGGHGTSPLLHPPGTIASLSLWRDWATIWESRADLFAPETVQGFAQLDTLAGQFFGGREFGPDVLGAFDPHWRLVIADQDYSAH